MWIVAALAASIPIPFISAGLNVLMYNTIPQEMQGRVFAVRNALQYFTIPLGILLGGALADYVFEPLMANGTSPFVAFLHKLVGTGSGSGMAVMFLCTSILGSTAGVFWYRSRKNPPTGVYRKKLNESQALTTPKSSFPDAARAF